MSKLGQIAKVAKEQGFEAAQKLADKFGLRLYRSAQWPQCGEVWNKTWTRKLADVTFFGA